MSDIAKSRDIRTHILNCGDYCDIARVQCRRNALRPDGLGNFQCLLLIRIAIGILDLIGTNADSVQRGALGEGG